MDSAPVRSVSLSSPCDPSESHSSQKRSGAYRSLSPDWKLSLLMAAGGGELGGGGGELGVESWFSIRVRPLVDRSCSREWHCTHEYMGSTRWIQGILKKEKGAHKSGRGREENVTS